jgi:hypothetical protein
MIRSTARHDHPDRRAHQQRRASRAIAAGSLALLLSACGVIAALIPPISVGDPLGVDGQVVTAALQDGAITTLSTTHIDTTRSLDITDLEANLHGFSVASFHTNAGLADEMTLKGPTGGAAPDHPARITITRALIEATLRDDVNGSVTFTHDIALALPFERTVCSLDTCTFAYTGTDMLADVLDLEITDRSTLERLVSILVLRETETPNDGELRVAIEIEAGTSLSGYVATFTLTSTGSTIRIGG